MYAQLAELREEAARLIPIVEALPEVRQLKGIRAAIDGLETYAASTRQRTGSRIISSKPESEFSDLSLPEAATKHLETVGIPQSPEDIWDALSAAGVTLTARKPVSAVHHALKKRMSKNHRLHFADGKWSLLPIDLSKGGIADGDIDKHKQLTKDGIAHYKARTGAKWGRKPVIKSEQIQKFRELLDSGQYSVSAASRQASMSNAYFYMNREAILAWKKGDPWPPPPQPRSVSGDELRAMGIIPLHARVIGENQ